MKSLGMLIILCAAGFFLYPLAVQRAGAECLALSRETLPAGPIGGASHSSPRRDAGGLPSWASHKWASHGWPRQAGCTWLYWQRMLDPPG